MSLVTESFRQEISRDNFRRYFEATHDKDLDSDVGGSAVNITTAFDTRFQLQKILFHFDAASTRVITIKFNSRNGANYDTVLDTVTMTGETDYIFLGTDLDIFQKGNELTITITSGAGAPHVYITVLAMEKP